MAEKEFDKIMGNWQQMIQQTLELFEEGRHKFINASKSYFDSMKYFSEISGNITLSSLYENLSENLEEFKKDLEKQK